MTFLFLVALLPFYIISDVNGIPQISSQCVAFRLDDIQDYFLNGVQMDIIKLFDQKNASLTIAIIGNYFGKDTTLISFLQAKIQRNGISPEPELEVANHGWNHEDLTAFNLTTQSSLIKKADEKILQTLGVSPLTLVPPYNMVNNDTFAAARENNILYISANITTDPPRQYLLRTNTNSNSILYHFPSTSKTGDLNPDNSYWYGRSHFDVFKELQKSIQDNGFAVVTLHPQEHSLRQGLVFQNQTDWQQINQLKLLIDEIKKKGLKIVPIQELKECLGMSR